MRRFVVPAAVVMCGILVGVWFLNERFQRPTFPPVVTIGGSTFVSEESRLRAGSSVHSHEPFPLETGDPTPIGGLHVSRDFGVVPNDGGNVVDSVAGRVGR